MKRSALLRKNSLRRKKFMSISRTTKRQNREGDPAYLSWIGSLPCSICDSKPPNHAHHSTGAGMGTKSHDREAMPMCWRHHRDFHDGKGIFDSWTREERRIWQELQVQRCQKLYSTISDLPINS